ERRRGDDRGRPRVGVRLGAVGLDAGDRVREAGQALGAARVEPQDVARAGGEHPLDPLLAELLLAVGDAGGDLVAQRAVALGVPVAERLLDPVQVVLLERPDPLDGLGDVHSTSTPRSTISCLSGPMASRTRRTYSTSRACSYPRRASPFLPK